MEASDTYRIDWAKVETVEDVKAILKSMDISLRSPNPTETHPEIAPYLAREKHRIPVGTRVITPEGEQEYKGGGEWADTGRYPDSYYHNIEDADE